MTLASPGLAAAEQLYVTAAGGAFNDSTAPIHAAVDAACEVDSIYVHGGKYYEKVAVGKLRLTLECEGGCATVTAASPDDRCFNMTKDYTSVLWVC